MRDTPRPFEHSLLYGRLRNELRQLAGEQTQIRALRTLLNGHPDDDPLGLLPNSKMRSWLLRGNKERLPNVAVEAAAMGMTICMGHLGHSEMIPPNFLDGPQDTPAGGPLFDEGTGIPSELLKHHLDALKTSWLYGDYAFHAVRIADPATDSSESLDAKIWRFFSGLRAVPPEFEKRIEQETTHLVHGSALDYPNSIVGVPESFGLEGREGEVISEPEENPSQVHFLVRLAHGEPPLTCGYSYGVKQRFLRHETATQRFDAFSSANAVVLKQGLVVVSFPTSQFGYMDYANGVLFATPIPMLPRVYVEKVADKAARKVLGRRHGLFSTWAKPADESRMLTSASELWDFAGLTDPTDRANFIEDSFETLFGPDRVVFAARFSLPNPLAYQSLMWKLPERGI